MTKKVVRISCYVWPVLTGHQLVWAPPPLESYFEHCLTVTSSRNGGNVNMLLTLHICVLLCYVVVLDLQNAGAVIGKGGSNIKRLRQDVSHRLRCTVLYGSSNLDWKWTQNNFNHIVCWRSFADHVWETCNTFIGYQIPILRPSVIDPAWLNMCVTIQWLTPVVVMYYVTTYWTFLKWEFWPVPFIGFHTCWNWHLIIVHLQTFHNTKWSIWDDMLWQIVLPTYGYHSFVSVIFMSLGVKLFLKKNMQT